MTFRSALTHLAALSVSGVAHNYDVDSVPDDLSRVQLPALLVLPIEIQDNSLFKERGEGFQTVAFSGGPRTVSSVVTHLLLVAPVEAGRGLRTHLPTLIDQIDAYFTALGADVTLGGTLLEPAHVRVEARVFQYGHASYVGCAFRHIWRLSV
jgi:hypothetical protein